MSCQVDLNKTTVLATCPQDEDMFVLETADQKQFARLLFSTLKSCFSGGLPFLFLTSTDFTSSVQYANPALKGYTYRLFWNDVNRYLHSSEYSYLANGGFQINIPGFDATHNSYEFYLDKLGNGSNTLNFVDWATGVTGKPASFPSDVPILTDEFNLQSDVIIDDPAPATNGTLRFFYIYPNGYQYEWGLKYIFSLSSPPPIPSTFTSALDVVWFQYHLTLDKWLCIGSSLGFNQHP